MPRKIRHYELPDDVRVVLECSPNLECCEEFRHADMFAFAKHLNERRCAQCIACFRQMDQELRTIVLLSEFGKRTVE
jgi:hypothetical protein